MKLIAYIARDVLLFGSGADVYEKSNSVGDTPATVIRRGIHSLPYKNEDRHRKVC